MNHWHVTFSTEDRQSGMTSPPLEADSIEGAIKAGYKEMALIRSRYEQANGGKMAPKYLLVACWLCVHDRCLVA